MFDPLFWFDPPLKFRVMLSDAKRCLYILLITHPLKCALFLLCFSDHVFSNLNYKILTKKIATFFWSKSLLSCSWTFPRRTQIGQIRRRTKWIPRSKVSLAGPLYRLLPDFKLLPRVQFCYLWWGIYTCKHLVPDF